MNCVAYFSIVILALFSSSSAYNFEIPSVENADGSWSIGQSSDSQGDTPESVAALLSFAQGWTTATKDEENAQQYGHEPVDKASSTDLSPTSEFFKLLEAIFRFKVQLISRAYQIFSDNTWLFQGIYNAFINNLGTVGSFTTVGIVIVRKILEYGSSLLESWSIPSFGGQRVQGNRFDTSYNRFYNNN